MGAWGGQKGPKKGKKRPKIAPRVNFDHLGVIWDKVAFDVWKVQNREKSRLQSGQNKRFVLQMGACGGQKEPKKGQNRPKIPPRVNFNHLGVIWDKVAFDVWKVQNREISGLQSGQNKRFALQIGACGGQKGPKKGQKRPKIAPRVNFNHLGVIWDKVAFDVWKSDFGLFWALPGPWGAPHGPWKSHKKLRPTPKNFLWLF